MHWDIGGFKPYDIDIVCAFDIDSRKVGKEIHRAIFEAPKFFVILLILITL